MELGSVSGPYPVYMSVVSSRPDPVSMGGGVGVVKWVVLVEVGGAVLGSIQEKIYNGHSI